MWAVSSAEDDSGHIIWLDGVACPVHATPPLLRGIVPSRAPGAWTPSAFLVPASEHSQGHRPCPHHPDEQQDPYLPLLRAATQDLC